MPANLDQDLARRRSGARRTALIVAAIAALVYVGFIVLNATAP